MRPVTQFDEGWKHIEKGIRKVKRIVEGLPGPKFNAEEYMLLYTTVFNMCTQNPPHHYSHQLYDKYKEVFVEYNTSIVLPFLTKQQHDHEFMLRNFVKRWEAHKVMVRWLSRFFDYLERFFVPRRSLPGLNEVGLACFRDFVYPQVKVRARAAVLGLLNKVREGEQIDSALLKNVINVFVDIGEKDVYQDLKAHILEDRGFEYFSGQASSWISKGISDPDYMLKAEECLKRERDIVCHCLLTSSDQQKLVEKVEHVLLEPLVNRFKQHVTAQVPILAKQVEDIAASNKASNGPGMPEEVLVEKLIELLDKYIPHVNGCFKDYYAFHNVLKVAFDAFFNKSFGGSSSVELLATFCDNVLKKGGSHEKLSDEAIEETLEKVVKLLPYIRDKDLFAEFYRKRLARRLLFDRSANKDNEKSMLKKMKQQCGRYFTSKMEGMVTDLTLAQDNQTGFEEYIRSNPNVNPGMDLTVTVLTSGFWPSYKSFDLKLPAEMVKCVEDFKGFYETKTAHRKLTWVNSLGTCNIIGNFEPKKIELVLPTFQASLLLLFNTADRLSYSEILTQLNVTHENLVRILHSLSCAKYKILIKDPNTKTISPKDNFEFNSKFTDRKRKIKIPLPPVDQRKEVIQDVDKDRRYAIDAAIVRIMKSQKVLLHQQLVMECIKQLTHMFKPDIKLIKKRIEDLITRDYLERDKNNLSMFKYIA